MEKFIVAACQISFRPDFKPRENAEKIQFYLKQAADNDARLVLFPELSLSGYSIDESDIFANLEATTPELIESIRSCVKKLGVGTVIGLYESAGGNKVYNVALAMGPDGSETRYQKMHIPPCEALSAAGQSDMVVANLGFIRLGMSICFDNWFPESARMAYLAGAEMLHMPFYWPAEWEVRDDIKRKRTTAENDAILKSRRERMLKVLPARALDNAMYVVMLDQVAQSEDLTRHLPGKSMVFDPYGELIAETKGWKEEVLYFWFLPERVREWRSNPFFPGHALRPEIYQHHFSKSQKLED